MTADRQPHGRDRMAGHVPGVRPEPWARGLARALWLLPRRLLIALVQAYRLLLKAWLGNACRFEPTCSAYALQALQRHGALAGSALGGWRLLRCHPWCAGGVDPVPDTFAAAWRRPGRSAAPGGAGASPRPEPADGPPATPPPAARATGPFTRLLEPHNDPSAGPEPRDDAPSPRPPP